MKRPKYQRIKQKAVIIPLCEGEAEINIFEFLKLQYSNKRMHFNRPIDIGGFNDLLGFTRKYHKQMRSQNLKPRKEFSNIRFLFIFDNDLEDSEKIREFLESEGHLVQQCDPNVEGLLLNMSGRGQGHNLKTEDFRKKCKEVFQKHFGCKAQRLKSKKLQAIFKTEKDLEHNLPTLYALFKG